MSSPSTFSNMLSSLERLLDLSGFSIWISGKHMTGCDMSGCWIAFKHMALALVSLHTFKPMLDYVKNKHHARTELNWDTSNPMFVSSLAFANDILLVVNNRHDLATFLDALNLYKMSSNAQVNEDKSQAFFLAKSQNMAEGGLEDDIPYPILGDSQAEIVHLGYPFCLDGGIPHVTIERWLTSIQAKVNILSTTKTTLLEKACMVNSFLLSKLWHTIHLCPIPYTLQWHLNPIINPFLFLGRRNWIRHAYVVTPPCKRSRA
ncbi:uncharacterized protein UBRO_21074 [Ustilago bromivora]|uniref:Reverse transcriptase domain-containing protein n=1 Tax=Ustilago bromivora TaxID=307758 RepID=A0A1K0GTA5_9BASI|nr:uncharacterized protein UBRO_21074 [Ustilago bromivora]